MKLTTWNCNMAFRKKAAIILTTKPDILIVPECEHPDKLIFTKETPKATSHVWFGENKNKGLGIFSYSNYTIEILNIHNPEFKYILPLSVYNDTITFIIFAIWAQKPQKNDCYTEQIWNAVHFYKDLLTNDNVILAGDFNSNSIWDKPNRICNHTNLVNFLNSKNIHSSYHKFNNQEHGKESSPTLYMHRKIDKPYHIDFCFASQNLLRRISDVDIGTYDSWAHYSDHQPLTVTFEI